MPHRPQPARRGSPARPLASCPRSGRATRTSIIDHGEGSWLVTTDGERYLDYTSGIGVTNTGPRPSPGQRRRWPRRRAKLLHGQQNIVYHEAGLRLHARLAELRAGAGWGAFLGNSGAEAVEAAVKLARVATGRPVIVAFRGGFHGRTAQAMALTSSRVTIRGDFEPLPGSVYHAPYPVLLPAAVATTLALRAATGRRAMEALFAQLVDPRRVAAFIIEPVIGEGGYIVPPPGFLPRLREIATAARHPADRGRGPDRASGGRDGSGRSSTGASSPDILVMAKGIASGLPLSGILAPRELLGAWVPGRPRRHLRRQRRGVRRGHRHARRDRATRGWWPTPQARGRQLLDGLRPLRERASRAWATCAGWAAWSALELVDPGPPTRARPTRRSSSGSSPRRWRAS